MTASAVSHDPGDEVTGKSATIELTLSRGTKKKTNLDTESIQAIGLVSGALRAVD
jgi:hypothetical protein